MGASSATSTVVGPPPPGEDDGIADLGIHVNVWRYEGQVSVSVSVDNSRVSDGRNVTLHGTISSVTGGWTQDLWGDHDCPLAGETVDCGLGNVTWSWGADVRYTSPSYCEAVTASFTVEAENDGFADNNTASDSVADICGRETDLAATAEWLPGDTSDRFRGAVKNIGAHAATAIVIQLSVAEEMLNEWTFVAPSGAGCARMDPTHVTCEMASLDAGNSVEITITIQHPLCGNWVGGSVSVEAENDLRRENDWARVEGFDPAPCDTETTLDVSLTGVTNEEERAVFEVTVKNLGPAISRETWIYVTLESHEGRLNWSLNPTPDGCNLEDAWEYNRLRCMVGNIEPGDALSFQIVQADGECSEVTAEAAASARNEIRPRYGGGGWEEVHLPGCDYTSLTMEFEFWRSSYVYENASYNTTTLLLLVENTGYNVAHDTRVTGTVSEIPDGWYVYQRCIQGSSLDCELGDVHPGWGFPAAYIYLEGNTTCAPIELTATVTASNEPSPSNNTVFFTTPDLCSSSADLVLEHTWFIEDDRWGYRSVVTNQGSAPADDSTFELSFDPNDWEHSGLDWKVEPETECKHAEDRTRFDYVFRCHLGLIGAGDTKTLELSMEGAPCGPAIPAAGQVYAWNELDMQENYVPSTFDPPVCAHEADLAFDVAETQTSDGRIRYEFTITNPGPSPAQWTQLYGSLAGDASEGPDWRVVSHDFDECTIEEWNEFSCMTYFIQVGESHSVVVEQVDTFCHRTDSVYLRSENGASEIEREIGRDDCSDATLTPTTPIPVFPSAWALTVGTIASLAGSFVILRRRKL